MPIKPASQLARQADGVIPLDVIGEIHCSLSRCTHAFQLDALVVKQLDVDVLAGNPFLVGNDVAVRPAKRQIIIHGSDILQYGAETRQGPAIRRTQAYLLRSPIKLTILPGEYMQLSTPPDCAKDQIWAMEP